MKIEDFKSGVYQQQFKFKNFIPARINFEWIWSDPKINSLLSQANQYLGELNAFSFYVPDVNIFIRMHLVKEATTSSKIEGTRTEFNDALLNKENINPEKRNDWDEVHNYIEAMDYSINQLDKIPVSTRLLKEAHKILLKGVRGEYKTPGEFRTSQNWIGGATLDDAVFIPPPHTEISELMSDLENFLHNENINVPHLIKIAIAHYQFETIHPFLDGNGRIGRLLITLYLVSSTILKRPTLYLSDYFEKHRTLYYENLNHVRLTNNLLRWIKFFLVAVIETSKTGIETFHNILKLKDDAEKKILKTGKKITNAQVLLKNLFSNPIVTSSDVCKMLKVTPASANSLINDFVQIGILREITGAKRNRVFGFNKYIELFTKNN